MGERQWYVTQTMQESIPLWQQGCEPMGMRRNPAGFMNMEYSCPNRPWGIPTGVGGLGTVGQTLLSGVGLVTVVALAGFVAWVVFTDEGMHAMGWH